MVGTLCTRILASLLLMTFALGGSAEATFRKTNVLSNVRTRIIPNFNSSGADVCFVYNGNNASVSTLVSVFPTGTLVLAVDTWTSPVLLGPHSGARVYSWAPLTPASEYCKVMVVR
jgi:hypothetical protein